MIAEKLDPSESLQFSLIPLPQLFPGFHGKAMGRSDDCCGFSGPLKRARKNKTQLLSRKSFGYSVRLAIAFFGQGNVSHSLATALTVPEGLTMANEIDCQPSLRCHTGGVAPL